MLPPVFDFLYGPVRDLVTQIYEAVGYLGVALWVAIESVIIPSPSELVLPFAGFLVGEGKAIEPLTGQPWNVVLVILFGTIGATLGALVAYAIGLWGGRPVIERWGRYLGITPEDLDRADDFFDRHGNAAAFFGRRFVVFTFLGSLPWTALLVVSGVVLGANWEEIGGILKRFEYLVLAVLAVIALLWIWFRIVKPRRVSRTA